ncbi:MAG: ATP-binding cassette domain-containing protein [Betaproteobacteria bacterium]|nr:ATP-binding cassette domain-containing protein [Betaproteobacteria bacterium]
MISFDRVTKRFPGGFDALRQVSFHLERGEMAFLTGPSGAGKSTILKLIAAIEQPTGGQLRVAGQNISRLRPSALPYLRRNLGLLFQDHKLLFSRTVLDNVRLPLEISGFDGREGLKRARAALDKVGLLAKEKAHPITLSGGEQQRLCIARAIVHRPSLMLADEPTSHLDGGHAGDILDMFRAFNQVGITLLIATHDETLIQRLPARVLRLDKGVLAA